jgi:hypothetical protein
MPPPQRDPSPQPGTRRTSYLTRSLSPSSVSMKDLLASCESAAAVSTPPCGPPTAAPRHEAAPERDAA